MLGQQDLAKLCWQRLLELQPENKSALRGLGRLAIEDKDLEGLKSLLNRMGKLQPPPEEYLQMKMRYGFHSGEPEVVLEAGEALLERNPGLIAPRRILIEAYRQLGREDKAEEHRKFIDRM